MTVYCKNARINSPSRIANVLAELEHNHWDVVLFSETRATESDLILHGGHRLITSADDKRHLGVAILFHARLADKVSRILSHSGRVMAVDVDVFQGALLRLVSVYAPHRGYGAAELSAFFCNLYAVCQNGRDNNRHLVVGGDFNTQLGSGTRSEQMHDFCNECCLEISNNDLPWESTWTFESSLGYQSRLDYLLVSARLSVSGKGAASVLDCGSDHRTVACDICLPSSSADRPAKAKKPSWIDSESYSQGVDDWVRLSNPTQLSDLKAAVCDAAVHHGAVQFGQKSSRRPWDTDELNDLRACRRTCTDKSRRSQLSKDIFRKTRAALRAWQTERATVQLEKFSDIRSLERFAMAPAIRKASVQPPLQQCAGLWRDVYTSTELPERVERSDLIGQMPAIELNELDRALKGLRRGKCADKDGTLLEMFACGGPLLKDRLLGFLNDVLLSGAVPPSWKELVFALVPKGGDARDANNWRPIAILDVSYKVFAKIICNRLAPILERYQSDEQFGFRPSHGTIDALTIFESVVGASIEWQLPLWVVSLDLTKAFDKIEHNVLMRALEDAGVPHGYTILIKSLYYEQFGQIGEFTFDISRGVRQGDILSPILFNTALEYIIRRWKAGLDSAGLPLTVDGSTTYLTNVRFADDLLVFGKSLEEVGQNFERLIANLASAGLGMNPSKTKVLTTDIGASSGRAPVYVELAGAFVEVLSGTSSHKYLGRKFPGNLRSRGLCNLEFRLSCAWLRYHNLRSSLTNRRVPLQLRLKLFDCVISPTVLYSLCTTPLTTGQLEKLDATQRKMMRKIVGWQRFNDETWETTGRRMKERLNTALERQPVKPWSQARRELCDNLLAKLQSPNANGLLKRVFKWSLAPPGAKRFQGHPFQRWWQ